MRSKKLIAIVLCSSLSVVAFAHPGRTDSNGGHYNHSTGEYHYHHGYPEHQHTDRDGDGTLDCPYRITGSLGSSSGSSSSSSKSGTIAKKKTDYSEKSTSSSKSSQSQTSYAEPDSEPFKSKRKKISFENCLLIGVGVLYVVSGIAGHIKKRKEMMTHLSTPWQKK